MQRTRSLRRIPCSQQLPLALALLGLLPPLQGEESLFGGFPGGGLDAEKGPVSMEVFLERSAIRAGEDLRIAIAVTADKDWHLYHEELGPPDAVGQPTRVTLTARDVTFGKVRFPAPEKIPQPGIGEGGKDTWIYGHHGKFYLFALGKVAGGGAPGPRDLEVKLEGLACKVSCVQVRESKKTTFSVATADGEPSHADIFKAFPADLTSDPPAAPPGGADGGEKPGTTVEPPGTVVEAPFVAAAFSRYQVKQPEDSRSFLTYVLLGLLAGFILNFMPCVLPVISIKVLSFVQQAGEDRKRVFRLGLTFCAGIVAVFLVLAGLAAFAGQSWGQQFQSQEFLVVMIGVVFAFSLSLFGVYEIGVPQPVASLGTVQVKEGHGDAFFKGIMATVLATPCSGPFLGSTLAWALTRDAVTIFVIFIAIGIGMALPYAVLTSHPAWLRVLPRPGRWMETFKQIMGFVLLATVLYLMVSLKQDLLLFTVSFLVFVAMACWLYGRYTASAPSSGRRFAVLLLALCVTGGGAWVSFGVFQGLFRAGSGDLEWQDFDPVKLQRLHEEGKSVMVDWTADWCPNCKFVEKFVLESAPIVALLEEKGVVALKADITHSNPETEVMKELQRALGSRSIPFLAIFPGDAPYRPSVLRDIYTRDDLRKILETLP